MGRQPWMDRVVADRMAVDREFTGRVDESRFSSQQWGLIMTATEFEIRDPESEDARLVADTSKLPQIMPELEKIDAQVQAAGGAGGVSGSGGGGGVLDSIKSALGLGGGADDEDLRAAEELVEEYANRLQERLENQGKWKSACEQASG